MKNVFKEYYPLSEQEINELWESALFVFDANVLLNFYRYSDSTVDEFIKVLNSIRSRIWLPYQVGKEVHRNRLNVISEQIEVHKDSIKSMESIHQSFSNKNRNPFLSSPLIQDFDKTISLIKNELLEKQKKYENRILNDDIIERIANLFEEGVGEEYSIEKMEEIKKQGVIRYSASIPPGYKDKSKKENPEDPYGDLIIWFQIIDKAKKDNKAVIFITDDEKEDWWSEKSGKALGPRVELRKEFGIKVNSLFSMYKPFRFLELAKKKLTITVDQTVIDEVKYLTPIIEEYKDYNNETETLVYITLKQVFPNSKIDDFVNFLRSGGYDVFINELTESGFQIVIPVPAISELIKRIKRKYVSQVEKYGFKLIKMIPNPDL